MEIFVLKIDFANIPSLLENKEIICEGKALQWHTCFTAVESMNESSLSQNVRIINLKCLWQLTARDAIRAECFDSLDLD